MPPVSFCHPLRRPVYLLLLHSLHCTREMYLDSSYAKPHNATDEMQRTQKQLEGGVLHFIISPPPL